MSIADLLRDAGHGEETPRPGLAPASVSTSSSLDDPLYSIRSRAQTALYERLGSRLFDSDLAENELRSYVAHELDQILSSAVDQLRPEERQSLVESIGADIMGLGPIEPLLADPTVTEIMVNADSSIFVERAGKLYETEARFTTVAHLRQTIEKIVNGVGRRIDESSPMVDARLPDGSRVHAIIPPLAVDGPMLTVRKFSDSGFTASDLIEFGTMSRRSVEFLDACVRGRRNILITGGTGTGKTTLLNVISSFIPNDERIVTIEDAVELRLNQHHVVRLEARPPNVEGRGEITIRELVRNSLRMRPDRIIVGEVRGGEALDMLQAMNTGHEGSLSTVHANAPRDAVSRLETMVMMSGLDLPSRAIREQIVSALDLVVHLGRLRDGTRRVVDIAELGGMEADTITMSSIYRFDFGAGVDRSGRFVGELRPTGQRPLFTEELADQGIPLPEDIERAAVDPFDDRGY